MARDWRKSLWLASFKGVPFWVERNDEEGSRRIVVHEFPMRDDPFLEDLGEGKRGYNITAYVASDRADAEANAVIAICAQRGPGIMVLPSIGPVLVRCLEFKRDYSKDQAGYEAINMKMVREGFATALATVSSLANLIFIAADNLATAAAASFVSNLQVTRKPDFVVAAANAGMEDAAAVLEAVRTTTPVDPAVSTVQRAEIEAIFNEIPELVRAADIALPLRIIASARALGDGLPADTAVRAFEEIISDPTLTRSASSAPYPTPSARAAAVNDAAAARTLKMASLAAYSEAIARTSLTDRPAGITLRANVAEYFEAEVMELPASEIDLHHAIGVLRDAVIEFLSTTITNLAPVLTVEANLSMPSLFWAWRLYQDPTRSTQIAERNRVAHPSFMPAKFEALAR
jgi:prophage DNA circulation protein